MKKIYFKLLLICLFANNAFAQTKISKTIYFESNAYQIKQQDLNWLDSMATVALNVEKYSVTINAYCDATHTDYFNLELSQLRANTVNAYLTKKNLNPQFITAKGNGELGQLNNNTTSELRQLNRRAEIVFTITEVRLSVFPVIKEEIKYIEPIKQSLKTELENLEVGKKIILEGLNFYNGSTAFLPSADHPLKELLTAMKNNPTLEILVIGHVCCQPSYDVSLGRAEHVIKYLVDNGISESRMTSKGVANTEPLVKYEYTEEDMAKNRRVEIVVKKL